MKARVARTPVPECILLYGMEDKLLSTVRQILVDLHLPERLVTQEETGQTIGYLTGLPGFQHQEDGAEPFSQPVLVMQGLAGPRMDRLLAALRGAGASIPLKAVVTPTNKHWTFHALCLEIEKEHQYMTQKHKSMHE